MTGVSFYIHSATPEEFQTVLSGLLGLAVNPLKTQLDRIEAVVTATRTQQGAFMKTLDDILAEAARQTTIEDSMEALLKGLKAQIDAAGGNQTKIDAAFAAFAANNDRAAKAIVDNTPLAAAA